MVVSGLGQDMRRESPCPVELGVLLKLLAFRHSAIVVAVDVPPGVGRGVHQLVGCHTHHGAIFFRDSQQVARPLSAKDANGARKSRGAIEKRAWVLPERVEEQIIDGIESAISNQLYCRARV